MHIVYAKLGQADAGDNKAKLMTKLAPEWVRTSDPVIRSSARYRWTTAPACQGVLLEALERSIGIDSCVVSCPIWSPSTQSQCVLIYTLYKFIVSDSCVVSCPILSDYSINTGLPGSLRGSLSTPVKVF